MSDPYGFTVDVDQNHYLPAGADQVDAVVTVTAAGDGPASAEGPGLEMILVDCSSSMSGDRIRSARHATVAAIAELRDGVSFTVITGTDRAAQVYPRDGGTAVADAATRAEATSAVGRLRAGGGTAIGTWLALAGQVADRHEGALKHAILLTDGENGEKPQVFAAALDAVVGRFTCDCRGVGTDWRVEELRAVASTLLGTVDIVADPADLAADFRAVMGAAMSRSMADVTLRLWTPRGATVRFVKQVAPTVSDLTDRGVPAGPQRLGYPLGSWGGDTRDYHVCVQVGPAAVGEEILAGRVEVVWRDEVQARGLIRAIWTDDTTLSTRISPSVAHYTGQAELAQAIQEGLAARKRGDLSTATAQLGLAVALAAGSGHVGTAQLLRKVVDVDEATGTVRLRPQVSATDEMTLDVQSTVTVVVRGGA